MKKIWEVYKKDCRNIFANYVSIIIVLGVCILPSFYAWFNIKANWDPYSNTAGIKIAVVNEDKGELFYDKEILIGDEIVEELKNNTKLGWEFVSKEQAKYGLLHRKYYASITIPEDFSSNLATINTDNPIKPKIIYEVNEKDNAIVPKITGSGATALQTTVTESIIATINEVIFGISNTVGINLENNMGKIEDLAQALIDLEGKTGQIEADLNEYHGQTLSAKDILIDLQSQLPAIQNALTKVSQIAVESTNVIQASKEQLEAAANGIEEDLKLVSQLSNQGIELLSEYEQTINNSDMAGKMLGQTTAKLGKAVAVVDNILQTLQPIAEQTKDEKINAQVESLAQLKGQIEGIQQEGETIAEQLAQGKKVAETSINQLTGKLIEIRDFSNEQLDQFTKVTKPQIQQIIEQVLVLGGEVEQISDNINGKIPQIESVLNTARQGVEQGEQVIGQIQGLLPTLKYDLEGAADKAELLTDDSMLGDVISLLENNPEALAEYISTPVVLEEISLYHIPNYGSAMAPFYTTLAIWVGGLIACAIFTTKVKNREEKEITILEEYGGKGLFFVTIALLQTIILVLGNIYLLGVYIDNTAAFIGVSLMVALVFMLVIYTMVSVLGNVGKGLAVILLVLQISSSGGTFPIEVIPPFFQKVSGFLPFTYGISAMRETQGGVVIENLTRDLSTLLIFLVGAIVFGLLLKKPLAKANHAFEEMLSESELGE